MELFEKINRAFGGWYEGLFGGGDDVRPKDILRKILVALEEHRKEGFDNKIYVPNQYVLEIAVDDSEEKEYLLSFLDRDELETAVRRYCQQNRYHIRGGLDFTIKEVEIEGEGKRREKVRVRCRYDSKLAAEKPAPVEPAEPDEPAPLERARQDEEHPTVYEPNDSEPGTVSAVAYARLDVRSPGRPPYEVPITRGAISVGRSPRAGNDLVLEDDGMVSRRHARIEMEPDGRFTVYDLDTTNGTRVNGRKVDNRALNNGDEITIGATRIIFRIETGDEENRAEWRPVPAARSHAGLGHRSARLVMTDGEHDHEEYVLASDTVIGRGATNDIVVPDRSIATRHVRLRRGEPFTVEALDSQTVTLLNGRPLRTGEAAPVVHGDRIGVGAVTFRFEGDAD